MTEKEMLDQVESLIDDRNSFIDPLDNDENNIFRKDKKALIWITKKYKEQLKELEQKDKEIQDTKNEYYSLINKIENKIDKYDYEFEKAKRKNDNDRADYYWDLIINFKKLLESEE